MNRTVIDNLVSQSVPLLHSLSLLMRLTVTHSNERVLARQSGAVVYFDDGLVYKYGDRVKRNEFDAMKLVAEHTSVPVPRNLEYAQIDEMGMIAMSSIPGTPLSDTWEEMPSQNKQSILTQLRGYATEWRKIPQPTNCKGALVCGVMGGEVSDDVPIPGPKFLGPFFDDATFRQAIGEAYYKTAGRRRTPQEVTDSLPLSFSSVLTHCDLVPRNILVDGAKITGIVDWEFAGWYPEYWEYATMNHQEWDNMVSSFIEPHPEALDAIRFVKHVLF
jgi:aminoglycoside phosphotransferase